jgi:hypothetical protein
MGDYEWEIMNLSAVLDGHHRVLIYSHFEECKLCSGSAKASAWHLMEINRHFLPNWVGRFTSQHF